MNSSSNDKTKKRHPVFFVKATSEEKKYGIMRTTTAIVLVNEMTLSKEQ